MNYTVSEINNEIKANKEQFIAIAERNYHKEISDLANKIIENKNVKLIMLAGPSGSGKTTTAHILCRYLENRGTKTHVISLDNFYASLDKVPLDSYGKADFESVYALDVNEIHECFSKLINESYCDMPRFDFKVAKRAEDRIRVELDDNSLAIVEGIHALNPLLHISLPKDRLFKLYISVSSSVFEDGKVALNSRQLRLCRRMSRDYIYRNCSAQNTLSMWQSVLSGEEKYLYPFKKTADYRFDTFHAFEPAVLKKNIEEIIYDVPEESPYYSYAEELISGLRAITAISPQPVPEDSLIREFIKGGIFEKNY